MKIKLLENNNLLTYKIWQYGKVYSYEPLFYRKKEKVGINKYIYYAKPNTLFKKIIFSIIYCIIYTMAHSEFNTTYQPDYNYKCVEAYPSLYNGFMAMYASTGDTSYIGSAVSYL
jgi:hypothetical protein